MHPCLRVDEIVRLIAGELVASQETATSVSLACCCKIFKDPVLDVLWETQNQLLRLLRSLPEAVWDGHGCTVSTPTAYARFRFLQPFDLKGFQKTSNGVRMGSFPGIRSKEIGRAHV